MEVFNFVLYSFSRHLMCKITGGRLKLMRVERNSQRSLPAETTLRSQWTIYLDWVMKHSFRKYSNSSTQHSG